MCRNRNILPIFAKVRPTVNTKKGKEEADTCGCRFLKCAINHHHSRIHRFNSDIIACREFCKTRLHPTDLNALHEKIKSLSKAKTETKRTLLDSKLQRLEDSRPPTPSRWVFNLSDRHLFPEGRQVLSKGLNFNVQAGVNRAEFLAAAELGITLIDGPEDVKQAARTNIVGALSSTHNHQILTTGEKKALEGLRRDHSVAILSSDKGRSTVVMDKAKYDQKALSLLQDSQTYTTILHDPTKKLQMKVERELKELKELKDKRLITEDDWRKMRPGDSIIPKFYGLPKIHKDNIPLRPIVAFRGSPTYNLASNLSKRLRSLVTNSPHMLLNSEDFLNRIKGVKFDQGDVMVSFDV
ncbi:uncharacterized protein LOC143026960 [Oratosquilla oratoria]|uniref:uncharacterized protein LOC143026960 n=1 Tax=Oratosquilla oratoria TaxID=337810 RepID=UPI003F7697AF